jgi:putative nucleotidyltransferase with HDIG domain
MGLAPVHRYVLLVCAAAAASVLIVPWQDLAGLSLSDIIGLALLMAFTLLAERLAVGMSVVSRGSTQTLTFIPILTCVLLFGPAAPVLLMVITGSLAEFYIRRKETLKAVFNVAQYVLSTSLAGWTFALSGGVPVLHADTFPLQLGPFLLFLLVAMGINQGTVFIAITLSQAARVTEVWTKFVGPAGTNALYDLLISPIAIIVTFVYWQASWPSLILSLLPLLFIRRAYLNAYRLEHANRDLLKALVKAIETRDPYTSGHSQRVAGLASRIAQQLGLSRQNVEWIETAALLHDVGKIDARYTDILRKPDSLSPEERAKMQSHVTKGVELLRSLSSVPEEVILSVLHHHERVDGRGYPARLSGDQISIGGKIIMVCDSVDAMLSDRPYRQALSIEQVREQLREHAERQFDSRVVHAVLESRVLEEHVETVRASVTGKDESRPQRPSAPPEHTRQQRRLAALSF